MQKRNTFQKAMTLDAVKALANHPSADEVYSFVSQQYPEISRATVYRNLNYFCETGALFRVKISGSADRFDHNNYPHYHFKCTQCKAVSDLDMPYMPQINEIAQKSCGHQFNEHQIFFDGICKECLAKNSH